MHSFPARTDPLVKGGDFFNEAPAGSPLARDQAAAPHTLKETAKVMVVDDDPIIAKLIQKYLHMAGYANVVGVIDARTVLRRIAEEQPDVVLLDIMMPEISGLEILGALRSDPQFAHLPVIIVTAADNERWKADALDLGATDFLGKPLSNADLVPRVRNAILVKANHDCLKHYAKELECQTRQLEAQIAQARTDALTGLANRRALDEELVRRHSESQRTGSPLSLLLLDVDHFKAFNDTFGHGLGDEVLRVLAGVLRGAMRQMDVITRYGGEEFLILLPGTGIECAVQVAERARHDINRTTFRYDGTDCSLSVSIGVAQLAQDECVSQSLQRVDEAMYASKAWGRNRTCWHDGRAVHPVEEPHGLHGPFHNGASAGMASAAAAKGNATRLAPPSRPAEAAAESATEREIDRGNSCSP